MNGHWRAAAPAIFRVLPPDRIPAPGTVAGDLPEEMSAAIAMARPATAQDHSNLQVARHLEELVARYDDGDSDTVSVAANDEADHDRYFCVERIGGAESRVFVRMLLGARAVLLREAAEGAVSIGLAPLVALDQALWDALALALDWQLTPASQVQRWHIPRTPPVSVRRWVLGHQVFCALSQGLVLAFRTLVEAAERGNHAELRRAATGCASLLHGTAAAFLFTSDFPAEHYSSVIRPGMMPPYLSDAFSGLMSVDHREFVQTLRASRGALETLRESHGELHRSLASGLAAVYDAHRLVCDRFVMGERSLRMSSECQNSAGEHIDRFKELRLKVFEATPVTARADAPLRPPHAAGDSHAAPPTTH